MVELRRKNRHKMQEKTTFRFAAPHQEPIQRCRPFRSRFFENHSSTLSSPPLKILNLSLTISVTRNHVRVSNTLITCSRQEIRSPCWTLRVRHVLVDVYFCGNLIITKAVREAATICPHPCDLDLLTLKVVSESRVTWATFVPILVFLGLSVLDLGPMYATDRQTDVRQHHRLMPPPYGAGA